MLCPKCRGRAIRYGKNPGNGQKDRQPKKGLVDGGGTFFISTPHIVASHSPKIASTIPASCVH